MHESDYAVPGDAAGGARGSQYTLVGKAVFGSGSGVEAKFLILGVIVILSQCCQKRSIRSVAGIEPPLKNSYISGTQQGPTNRALGKVTNIICATLHRVLFRALLQPRLQSSRELVAGSKHSGSAGD